MFKLYSAGARLLWYSKTVQGKVRKISRKTSGGRTQAVGAESEASMPTKDELKELQALPLERKILVTQTRIMEWYFKFKGQVYVSFSGGKDSTVLLNIARKCFPDIEAVFVNTGLEYPEIQAFAKSFNNVTVLRPQMRFDEVIRKYGYPFISKEVSQQVYETHQKPTGWASNKFNKDSAYCQKYGDRFCLEKWKPLLSVDFNISHICCKAMKKKPVHTFGKKSGKAPITAQTAEESHLRELQWIKNGCNGFDMKQPISNPMSFWTEQDILQYIKRYNLPIASVYGDIVYETKDGLWYGSCLCDCGGKLCTTGLDRTGCIFCGFAAHLDKGKSRFERLKITHPRQYEYCMGGGAYDTDGLWKPTKEGLGMAHCIDELNKIYGPNFIRH